MRNLYFIVFIAFTSLVYSCTSRTPDIVDNQQKRENSQINSTPVKISLPEEEALLRNASLEGDFEIIQQLLAINVDVNALDQEGRTALMFAAYNGKLEIVKALVEKAALVNLQDYSGRSALMFASSGKFPATVEFLLVNKADPNLVDSEEKFTALMFAAAEGNMEVVKLLLAGNADPNMKDVDGETAEIFARNNGHVGVAEFFGEMGVDHRP